MDKLRARWRAGGVGVLIAPNFAIGAILMMRFAARRPGSTSRSRSSSCITPPRSTLPRERRPAPPGSWPRRSEAGLGEVPDATADDPDGARGARIGGIPVHSVRLRGLVAHQEVLLGATGEMLTMRHDSFDRVSFMPGVIEASAACRAPRGHGRAGALPRTRWVSARGVTALVLFVVLGFYGATIGWRGVELSGTGARGGPPRRGGRPLRSWRWWRWSRRADGQGRLGDDEPGARARCGRRVASSSWSRPR